MINNKGFLIVISTITLTACGSGGATSNNYSGCMVANSSSYLTPSLNPTPTSNTIAYLSNGGLENNISVVYGAQGNVFQGESSLVIFADTSLGAPSTGSCMQAPVTNATGDYAGYQGDTMYWTQCSASVESSIMTFNANYGIYTSGQYPGNGTAFESGTVNFTCALISN